MDKITKNDPTLNLRKVTADIVICFKLFIVIFRDWKQNFSKIFRNLVAYELKAKERLMNALDWLKRLNVFSSNCKEENNKSQKKWFTILK